MRRCERCDCDNPDRLVRLGPRMDLVLCLDCLAGESDECSTCGVPHWREELSVVAGQRGVHCEECAPIYEKPEHRTPSRWSIDVGR